MLVAGSILRAWLLGWFLKMERRLNAREGETLSVMSLSAILKGRDVTSLSSMFWP